MGCSRISTWERGTAGWGEGELGVTARPHSWSLAFTAQDPAPVSQMQVTPGNGLPWGPQVGWLQNKVIWSPSQQLGVILKILRRLWTGQQRVRSSGSLSQGQTRLT